MSNRLFRTALFAALTVTLPLHAQTAEVHHPLDGLTTDEYWTVHDVLAQSGHMTEKTLVASLLLHEPDKATVMAWKPGEAIPREADVYIEDEGKTIEARVDVANKKLESWKVIPGVQAPITLTELNTMSDIIKHDPRVVAALKARGITDLSTVECDPIPITFIAFPEQKMQRIGYGSCDDNHGVYHAWGRAIDGLYILSDVVSQKVLRVDDTGIVPMSRGDMDFEEAKNTPRANTKPLYEVEPEGPSYTIKDGEVAWQGWKFRFRLDSRLGPVVNLVHIQDGDRYRSVMYEGAISEMFVPYQSKDKGWATNVYADNGEFLRGGIIRAVAEGDCPAHAQYFSGIIPSDQGTPILTQNMACLFEHVTDAPAWRHYENGIMSTKGPTRELTLRTAAVVGNYDYLLDWTFEQDGTIKVAVGATGIVETENVKEETQHEKMGEAQYGTLVDSHLLAVNHDHFFSYRLDMDVDGPNNTFMIDRAEPEKINTDNRTSIWVRKSMMAHTEQDAIMDLSAKNPAMWSFVNPSQHNRLGYATGYEIMPGMTGISTLSPDDPAQKIGAFAEHQFWVTPYKPDERYASGVYVTSSTGDDGLAAWAKQNRPIENTDIVGWYTLGFHHMVRDEDWPIMPTLWHDFLIRPVNFFDRNPVLDLSNDPHQQPIH